MKKSTITAALMLTASFFIVTPSQGEEVTIPVTYDNFNQAETARNFNNWAKLGGNNTLLHLEKLSPIGNKAPTIRMNLDTLYSVGVYDNDGDMTLTIPKSGLSQSVMILSTDGYTPFFFAEPGVYPIKHKSKTLFFAVRTSVKDRHSEASFKEAYAAQAGIKVEGNGPKLYVMPLYDQEQLHKLTAEYNKQFLAAGIPFTFGDGVTPVNEEHRTWSNAAGWGGMVVEVGKSNYYTSSENLPGDVCLAVTFPETGNKYFTSFTIYDTDGYLMEGNSHINSYTWKSNNDGSTTIHFNCGVDKVNNITSNGAEFNYVVRNYGASQKVVDELINPIKPLPQMKMTTEVPAGIATPDKLDTQLGTLTSFDGVPDAKTTQLVYDNLDLQRATQAYLSTLQIASMYAMEQGLLTFGPANTTILTFDDLMDSKALWLTPNTVSVYMVSWMELGDEPMVIETPPNVLGFINDAWFKFVADFGNAGPDKGKGGKFLIIPPGYEGEIPEGYHVARTSTHGNWVIWRGSQVDGSTKPAIDATKKLFRMYPLSKKDNPPKMDFVNVSGKFHNTIHRMDYGFWEELNAQIQAEPIEGLDPETRGLLASIGIEKGREFKPDARMQKILTEAANVGAVTARALTARPKDQRHYLYPGERVWTNPFIDGRYDFLLDGARLLDARVYMHFYATGITPAMAIKNVGKGSQYAIAYLDKDGNALDGGKTYKINLPANVPAKDFWSFTAYDNQTRAMLQTDQRLPGLDNNKKGLKKNADGSFDIYFSPKPPKGWENNWIQTVPSKGWNTILRLYGPLESFYDQSWKPGDPEMVK